MSKRIVISVNSSWNVINYRKGLVQALDQSGYEVVVISSNDKYTRYIGELGCRFYPVNIDSSGVNPFKDFYLFVQFLRVMMLEKPCALLAFTVKPNIYGSLASAFMSVPVINNVSGLGAAFSGEGILKKFLFLLYKISFFKSKKIFFQNNDDLNLFLSKKIISSVQADRLPGSGVDLDFYSFYSSLSLIEQRFENRKFRFYMISRLLIDKGVREYAESARIVLRECNNVEFYLVGFLDEANSSFVPLDEINEWQEEGLLQFMGESDEVIKQIQDSDCIVLPSYYREGVPRVLLESASIGRPIITTDSIGCREAVDDGVNGFLCKPRCKYDLANKMKRILSLSSSDLFKMSTKGRKKIEREFDQDIILKKYISALNDIAC